MEDTRTHRAFTWIGRHAGLVTAALLLAVIGLGIAGPLVADTNDADFDPESEVFAVAERADTTLRSDSTIRQALFIVEAADGGDVLTADAFREWSAASERVRSGELTAQHLVERYDPDTGTSIPGVLSVVDVVEAALPMGLEGATDAEVKAALATVFGDGSPYAEMRFSLSEQATYYEGPGGVAQWAAPAITAQVAYDEATFLSDEAAELWLREVQAEFREGAVSTDSIGVAIDGETTFAEAAEQSAPFIFLAVALIIVLIAVVHRSYWSAVIAGAGLAATTIAYYGTAALLGLKMGSLLLAFVVPIAMVSFGVDFFIHGVGRVREAQIDDGLSPQRAYAAGMAAVFTAMLLAAASSIAAFLSNAASGIEAIAQFGMGAALALFWAYVILGQIAPRVLLGIEGLVGENPVKGVSRFLYAGAMLIAAVAGGLTVALAAVMPAIGLAAFGIELVALIGIPALLTRQRNRRAAARGRAVQAAHRGSAHGLRPAGSAVHTLARWRVVTIPVALLIGAAAVVTALNVETGFELSDFVSSDTEFSRSIVIAEEHFPSSGQGNAFIFVEGDLTDPGALALLDDAVSRIDASGVTLGRNAEGGLLVALHAADLVRMTMAAPAVVAEIEAGGTPLTDVDGNGIPDTAAGVRAIYDHIGVAGVPTPDGEVAITPVELPGRLADDGRREQATAIVVMVGSYTDGAVILPVHDLLEDVAADLETAAPAVTFGVSGEVITQYFGMEAFTNSMLLSLPLAVLLTALIASLLLRSFRYALVSVIPIGFVVTGVYAFMAIAGYTVNVVTATIAAIAVGVGIDFSTHFTARFREELRVQPTRLAAVRRAGEGTGGALVLSALTSVLGFTVMALAPTPIFATFGTLTAVMIGLSLVAALFVLPSLLVLVTPAKVEVRDPLPQIDEELVLDYA
jgi:predicted RND superfamily exporter protein